MAGRDWEGKKSRSKLQEIVHLGIQLHLKNHLKTYIFMTI